MQYYCYCAYCILAQSTNVLAYEVGGLEKSLVYCDISVNNNNNNNSC